MSAFVGGYIDFSAVITASALLIQLVQVLVLFSEDYCVRLCSLFTGKRSLKPSCPLRTKFWLTDFIVHQNRIPTQLFYDDVTMYK